MIDFLIYDLKVAVLIIVFYMFYRLMLAKETFHRVNRLVLLLTAIASFVLPLCVITFHKTVVAAPAPIVEIGDMRMAAMPDAQSATPLWQMALPILYIAGALATLGKSLASILKVMLLIRKSEKHPSAEGITICVTDRADVAPFSWMHYIVMNRSDYEAQDAAILAHERGHIHLRHSWDVLLVDLLTALQWFNPAMWMLRQDLRAIHEYEADGEVLSQGINARQYQYLLISKAASIGGYSIANGINHSTLKNRINMMLHRKSQSSHLLKLLALIPIVSVALALNAETVTDVVYDTPQKQVPVKKGKKSTTIKAGPGKDIQIIETESTDGEDQQAYDVETFPIKGKVYDVDDRSPIVGAVVKIVGSTKGTVTDREGNFRLEVSVGNRIEVLYAGYDTYTIGVSKAYAKDNNYMVGLNKEGTYQDKGRVFDVVENMPQFPGGPQALFEFISKNIRYPEEAEAVGIQGRVLVSFVVEKDGSISEPNIVKQIDPSLDAEALRVVNSMPDWEPGTQNGEPIRVKYTIPITFRLDGGLGKDIDNIPKDVDVEVDGQLVDPEVLKQLQGGKIDRITIEKAKSNGERSKIVITTKKVK